LTVEVGDLVDQAEAMGLGGWVGHVGLLGESYWLLAASF
jgi:hypothetical protein